MPAVHRSIAEIAPGLRGVIRSCVVGESPWPLVIHGKAGTGKTCAALCVLDYSDGEYFTVSDLCEKLNQSMMGRLLDSGRELWPEAFREKYLATPPLLVLDELGLRTTISDSHYEAVYRAIELRHKKPFIVVSNHPVEKIGEIYDGRTASRLGSGTVVELSSDDRRLV